jgi:hypothetical protein
MDDKPVTRTQDQKVALRRGRMIFPLDATASRESTWGVARELQAEMFRETAPIGHLDLQLVYYRGEKCRASEWVDSGEVLAQLMNRIECEAGRTQIGRVLQHALRENDKAPIQAVTFIGDAMEESIEELAAKASELGKKKIPLLRSLKRYTALSTATARPFDRPSDWRRSCVGMPQHQITGEQGRLPLP